MPSDTLLCHLGFCSFFVFCLSAELFGLASQKKSRLPRAPCRSCGLAPANTTRRFFAYGLLSDCQQLAGLALRLCLRRDYRGSVGLFHQAMLQKRPSGGAYQGAVRQKLPLRHDHRHRPLPLLFHRGHQHDHRGGRAPGLDAPFHDRRRRHRAHRRRHRRRGLRRRDGRGRL